MKLLIDAIAVIANKLGYAFVLGDEAQANIANDFSKLPVVVFTLLRFSDNANATNLFGTKDRTYFAKLEVLHQSQIDYTDTQRVEIFQQADKTLTSIIYSLRHARSTNGNKIIGEYVSVQGTFVKNKYDANLDGVTCEIAFKLPNNQNEICPKDYEILD